MIEEARNGRMFILVDDEDRENEGDLVIPAQFATPDAINFMARHARGLICLALTRQRVEQLGLPLMAPAERHPPRRPPSPSRSRRARASPPASPPPTARTPSPSRSTRSCGARRHRHARPCLPADGARGRRAGPRRPHRGGGRHRAPGRAEPGRRDLRDHERRRHHGAPAGPRRLRAAARPQDRHHRRPDRLSPADRTAGAARRGGHVSSTPPAATGAWSSMPTRSIRRSTWRW